MNLIEMYSRLKYGVTKFGRATSNDYYLDSAKLKNFISRIHAEIHAIPCDNGDVQFRIIDKGLNGTFINDTKVCIMIYNFDELILSVYH